MKKNGKSIQYNEFIVPAIMLAVMAVFLYQSVGISRPQDNLRLVWIVVGVLTLSIAAVVFQILKGRERTEEKKGEEEKRDRTLPKRQAALFVLVAVYVFLLDKIGFIVSSTLLLPFMFLSSGVRQYKTILAISLLLPVVTYIVFRRFFNILLPEGFIEEYLVNNVLYRKW
jgi:cobalamin synthase